MPTGQKLDEPKLTANTAKASHCRARCFISSVLFLVAMASVAVGGENTKITWGPISEDAYYQSLQPGYGSNTPGCYFSFAVYKVYYEIGAEGYADVKDTNPAYGVPCTIYRRRADGTDGAFKPVARILSGYIWNQFIDYDVVPDVEYVYEVRIDKESSGQPEWFSTGPTNLTAAYTYRAELGKNEISFDADSGEQEVDVAIYKVTPSGSSLVICPDIRTTLIEGDFFTWKHENGDGISTDVNNYNAAIWVDENDTGAPREWLVYIGFVGCDDPFLPMACGSIRVRQAAKEDMVSVDTGTGSAVAVSKSWLSEKCAAALTANGGDFTAAALGTAANGRKVWQCYVLGLDPAEATNDFRIVSIELVDGKPKVEWEPKTNRWTGAEIRAVLKGVERLEGPWADVPTGGNPAHRFFKVVVEAP